MSEIRGDRFYSKSHEWLKLEDDTAYIGITDFAQDELGDIVYVEAEAVGEAFDRDEIFGSIESVKMASDLYLPVAGEILEFNEALAEEPELLNSDPYDHWIIKLRVTEPDQVDDLLDSSGYEAFLEEL